MSRSDTAAAARAQVSSGLAEHNAGALDRAAAYYRGALELDPSNGDALHLLGVVAHMRGAHEEAFRLIGRAIRTNRKHAGYHANLGRVLMALGQPAEAADALSKALKLDKDFAPARLALGQALLACGRASDAVRVFHAACRATPDDIAALLGHAMAVEAAEGPEAALAAYDAVLASDPGLAKAHVKKGNALSALGRSNEALHAYDAAIAADPDLAEAHANRGAALIEHGDAARARQAFGTAVAIRPSLTRARWGQHLGLPVVYESQDELDAAREGWEEGLGRLEGELKLDTDEERAEALIAVRSSPPFLLHYQGRNDTDLMRRWGALVGRIVQTACPDLCTEPERRRRRTRPRIGFVSSFFQQHSIFKTHGAWIEELDPHRFELFVFHTGARQDDATRAIKRRADRFLHLAGADIRDAERIRSTGLDVLIHCDIGMDPVSQFLAALRLAPVQANGLGHPVTCGLETIDYALSSALMEPADGETHYTEELVRLANLASCYRSDGLDMREPRGVQGRTVPVFLCAQSLFKLLPADDDHFARIAQACGPCRIRFIRHASEHVTGIFMRRLARAFASRGLDANDYCELLDRMDREAFLKACGEADVLLDGSAWSGNNSTLEGLAVGTPVVTLPGALMRARHGAAILDRMGLKDLIAEDAEGYVEVAVRTARDRRFRADCVERMVENRPRVYDDMAPVRDLERFLEHAAPHA